MKVCTECKASKPLDAFYKDTRGADGLYARCKSCHNDLVKRNYERTETKEKRRKQLAAKRETINAQQRARWAADPERHRAYSKKYHQAHPEQSRKHVQARLARLAGAEGSWTVEEWKALCEKYGNKCLRCNKPEVTVDHVVPLSRGGSNSIDNLQPLCGSCNSSKCDRVLDYRYELPIPAQ